MGFGWFWGGFGEDLMEIRMKSGAEAPSGANNSCFFCRLVAPFHLTNDRDEAKFGINGKMADLFAAAPSHRIQ
jgi:hypothetical protein